MAVKVILPSPLREMTGGKREIVCKGATISDVIDNLEKICPGMKGKILDVRGQVSAGLNIFLNKRDIKTLNGLQTRVGHDDEIMILPIMAGG